MPYLTEAQRHDVLVVGDVATDVIIRVPEGAIGVFDEGGRRLLELPLGEKLAIERDVAVLAGGSASNASVALARLGARVALVAFLAHDAAGFDLLTALRTDAVDTHLVHVDDPARTNRDFVLEYRGERTILVCDGAFNYHWPHLRPADMPSWLYLTSLGRDALVYQDEIADWLEENPHVRLVFQPGTFQLEVGTKRLERLYRRAECVFLDLAGARRLLDSPDGDAAKLAARLESLGCRNAVVCDEHRGGAAATAMSIYTVPPFPDTSPPLDTTGARDAFAASVLGGLLNGCDIEQALRWGAANAMSVSHELGSQAGLLHLSDLLDYLADDASGGGAGTACAGEPAGVESQAIGVTDGDAHLPQTGRDPQ